jgi:hypothetical protein
MSDHPDRTTLNAITAARNVILTAAVSAAPERSLHYAQKGFSVIVPEILQIGSANAKVTVAATDERWQITPAEHHGAPGPIDRASPGRDSVSLHLPHDL